MIKNFLKGLTLSRKTPSGKKGLFVKWTGKFALILLLAGCSYHSITQADVEGKNIRYPLGFKSIKGDAKVHLRREMSINHTQPVTDDKYLSCLEQLNQCVITNKP